MINKHTCVSLLLLLICVSGKLFSQVGIGTTTPHSSSILDISSTAQGVLAPRMTTAQRTGITSPANGLLVYDTEEGAFYYYEDSVWNKLQSQIRDNYKLVKNISDLAEELALGGGVTYRLQSNYLYEINGIINVDFPIELNNAYLKGEDINSDVLINSSGGTLFVGNTGGNLKTLSVEALGQQIFDITGTGNESFISSDVNYYNSSSVGTLSSMGVVFFNTGQFSGNNSGITASNVTSFFMTLFTWATDNTGTFLELSGTFDEVQLANARLNINAGEVGIDVSGNPAISGAASLAQVSFDGAGTYVNGYSVGAYAGYSFSNSWHIQSQGISQETDKVATGSLYITGTSTTVISAVNSPVKLAGTTTGLNLLRTSAPTNNRLEYLGNKIRYFNYNLSLSVTAADTNRTYAFYIYKNGVQLPESVQSKTIVANAPNRENISLSGVVELSANDYIEVWVENLDNDADITAQSMNLVIY